MYDKWDFLVKSEKFSFLFTDQFIQNFSHVS